MDAFAPCKSQKNNLSSIRGSNEHVGGVYLAVGGFLDDTALNII
jgi:hypothetical protein